MQPTTPDDATRMYGRDDVDVTCVVYRAPSPDDWLRLRCELWPEAQPAEHAVDIAHWRSAGQFARVAYLAGEPVGLVEAAVRTDYVNGTESSPVAFLEGLYVRPESRRRGVAAGLVREVLAWAQSQGLAELASDSALHNTAAHAMHRALGFAETERVVYFSRQVAQRE